MLIAMPRLPLLAVLVTTGCGSASPPSPPSGTVPPAAVSVEPTPRPHSAPPPELPSDRWTEARPKGDGTLHFLFTFQDEHRVWQCEGHSCSVVYGPDAPPVRFPCVSTWDPTGASPSGTWVARICDDQLHLRSLVSLTPPPPPKPLGGRVFLSLSVDDLGTVTATGQDGLVVRWPVGDALREVTLTNPHRTTGAAEELLPADGRWLAHSDNPEDTAVLWTSEPTPKPIRTHGRAFRNRQQFWGSLLAGGYVRVDGTSLVPVQGRFGGGLGGHGFLMDIEPWGPRGLLIVYETAVQLKDPELETVAQITFPPMEGLLDVGANPSGKRLHVAGPYGEIYLRGLPEPP